MDNYYKDKLKEINSLISEEEFEEAHRLIETELKMPYIPLDFQNEFENLANETNYHLAEKFKGKTYSEEEVMDLLNGNNEQASKAIEIFRSSNIRNYLDAIQTYLSNHPAPIIRSILIEALMDQDITDDLKLDYDGLEVNFIPTYVEAPLESDGAKKCIEILQSFFENDNPSLLRMCLDSLVKELYFKLPFEVENDEAMYLAIAIVNYVYKASNDADLFDKFINEKNLANYQGYDLLLNKYEI